LPQKRHKLLGLVGAKREFWLFCVGDVLVARLTNGRLQTFGDTPKSAITALRRRLSAYLRVVQGDLTALAGDMTGLEAAGFVQQSAVGSRLLAKAGANLLGRTANERSLFISSRYPPKISPNTLAKTRRVG
jgi:hypothetical protein